MVEVNSDVEARQRDAADHLIDMVELGLFRTHKLAPRRGVIEEIQHFKSGTHRMGGRFYRDRHLAPFGIGLPRFLLLSGARSER